MLSSLKEAFSKTDELTLITDDAIKPSNAEILFVNDAFLELTGYRRDEVKSLATLQSPEIDPQTLKVYKRARQHKDSFQGYLLGEKKSGEYYWVDLTMIPYHDKQVGEWYFIHKPKVADEYDLIRDRAKMMEWTEISAEMGKIGLWEFYPANDRAFYSNSMYEILGIQKDEAIASFDLYKSLVISDDRPLVQEKIDQIIKTGDSDSLLHRIRRADNGKLRFLRGYAKRDISQSGITKLYGLIQDVTEYQHEREQSRIFKKAVESANAGIIITDYNTSDNPIIYSNPAFEQITGYNHEEIQGSNCRFLQNGDRSQDERYTLRKAVEEGTSTEVTLRNYRKDGEMFWNHLQIAPIYDEQQNISHYIGVQEDITEEIKLRNKLEESRQNWKKLVELNPDLIAIHNEGKFIFVNQAGAEVLGLESPREAKGKDLTDILPDDEKETLKQRLKKLNEGQSTDYYTYPIQRMDGDTRNLKVKSIPIQFKGSQAILTVGQDVTTEREKQNQLEELLKQKEILISEIHHRVKNNMAIISGLLDLQKDRIEDPTATDAIGKSQLRIQTMANVHEQLYQTKDLTDIKSTRYISDLISQLQNMYGTEDIKLTTQIDDFEINVNQAVPLGMLLNELISNAFEHAFDNAKNARISVMLNLEHETIHARVSDNGLGIPEEVNTDQPASMGYTIIQTLVKQIGAELNIDSNHEGTSVDLKFKREALKGSTSNLTKNRFLEKS